MGSSESPGLSDHQVVSSGASPQLGFRVLHNAMRETASQAEVEATAVIHRGVELGLVCESFGDRWNMVASSKMSMISFGYGHGGQPLIWIQTWSGFAISKSC